MNYKKSIINIKAAKALPDNYKLEEINRKKMS